MRIRSTKPEFWRSKTIAALDWDVRLVLKGLESYVDDNGVGKDDIDLIASDVFPRDLSRDSRDTLARLTEAISTLDRAGLVVRYLADDEELLYIDKWKDLQRIDKPGLGRFPRPDGTFEYKEPVDRDSYARARETRARALGDSAPGTGEQGNRGTGEQGIDISPVSPVTNVLKRAGDLEADRLIELAREAGIGDLQEIRSTIGATLGREISLFDALVFSEDVGKLALWSVDNLGGFVAKACNDTPDDIRMYWAQYEADKKGAA